MLLTILAILAICVLLAFFRASIASWILAVLVIVPVVAIQVRFSDDALKVIGITLTILIVVFGIPFVRRIVVSNILLSIFRKVLPQISATEQEAIEAGTVWWDGELFSGNPHWDRLLAFPKCGLRPEEQDFLDNEVDELCGMLGDWDITHSRDDFPPEVWQFIKDKGFLGMIIPKKYGGLQFSAQAHSAVVAKISSRSAAAAVAVMAPNSLGPSEWLSHYGTHAQKEKYLRRLANGQELPCFALTGPLSGLDAGDILDTGIVCYGEFAGEKGVLGLRLTWEKRYIPLAPKATLLGLAFKLYDPELLLGGEKSLGITLALIPTDTLGVEVGCHHFPLNATFLNGPTRGVDVFVPMEYIIGGASRVGQGWHMLMECLAASRSISLPASSVGVMKLVARTCGAYSRVRKQFKVPIGKFEGVEEPLTRIGAHTYMIDAGRRFIALAVDMGEKPSVVSAIIKYHATDHGRIAVNDAIDIHGGKGICLGSDTYLGRFYQKISIGAAVEGANILTRTQMIFGQGAIRSHPYVLKEIAATKDHDRKRALRQFDEALFSHVSFALSNAARSFVFGLTGGHGIHTPAGQATRRYYQHLTRFSAAFALSTDLAMAFLGGALKQHESLSARLSDVLSQLYLCSAMLKRFEDEGAPRDDLPLLDWAMQDALYKIQQAFDGVIQNFPNIWVGKLMSVLIFPIGKNFAPPSDSLGRQISNLLMQPGETRDRLTSGIYVPDDEGDAVGALEAALASTLQCEPIQARVDAALKAEKLVVLSEWERISEARDKDIINSDEALLLDRDYALRRNVIMVDDSAPEQLG
jgi:acyl-CoA dehydrogenase